MFIQKVSIYLKKKSAIDLQRSVIQISPKNTKKHLQKRLLHMQLEREKKYGPVISPKYKVMIF